MHLRSFADTGRRVSEVGIGTWQLGGAEWGEVSEDDALATLAAAVDHGVNFIDTADIYGDGRSERLIAKFKAGRSEDLFVATKFGRSSDPGWPGNFRPETVRSHTEESLRRLRVEALDLTQSHCVPVEHLKTYDVFGTLARLQDEGKIRAFGASVESMDEALWCLEQPGLRSLQVIFNVFRQKPIETLFAKAKRNDVAVVVRLPLASGLLAGKFRVGQTFPEKDHRNFNRDGEAFNVGETFAGLPFEKGVALAESLRRHVPDGATMAQWALRWCLDFDAVTTVIPGASRPRQAEQNAAASALQPVPPTDHAALREWYQTEVADHIRGPY